MVFVTVFIIIISRANVGNWTALRVDLSSHIHHVFFSRPSDVAKSDFSSFLHRLLYAIHCMFVTCDFFYIVHRFFILPLNFCIFASFLV